MKKWQSNVCSIFVALYALCFVAGIGVLVYMGYENERKSSAASFEFEHEKGRAEWSCGWGVIC